MRANLFVVSASGTATLVDGNMTNYDSIYSNNIDMDDAWKMTNPGFNFGILRDGYNLAVERRSLIGTTDTTFFRMWNITQHDYRIKFMLKNLNHPGLVGVVKDKFLNKETVIGLNDTTYYDFTVNANPASADQMRFQFIYRTALAAPVDVNFTGIQAQRKGKLVEVQWGVANEESMLSYIVEHSEDGAVFHEIQQQKPYNTPQYKTYTYNDQEASSGNNFYRIKGLSMSGRVQYSPIAKISALASQADVNVYPNPVQNKAVQLSFTGMSLGSYRITLLYGNGSKQQLRSVQVSGAQCSQTINLPSQITPGVYQLLIVGPDQRSVIKKIIEVL